MNCPRCGSPRDERLSEYLATGDWTEVYQCGSRCDDNGNNYTSKECEKRAAKGAKPCPTTNSGTDRAERSSSIH